jgi:hypothetical protein
MNERTRTSLEILQVSALVGVLGNVLLRQTPWGLNAFLFVSMFVVGMLMIMWRRRPELLTMNTVALAGAMVFFASMFLIRDSIELRVYDTFAIIIIMGVILLENVGVKAHIAGAFHYACGFIWSGITSVFGPIALLAADLEWNAMPGNKISRAIFAVLRGLAIALPLLLIFGGLFMAADAAFEGVVNRMLNFDLDVVVSHIVLTSVLAWLTAGYFRGAMAEKIFMGATVATSSTAANASGGAGDKHASFVEKVAAEPPDNSSSLPDNATILEHINRSDPPNVYAAEATKKRDWQNFDNTVLPSVFTLGTVETVIILGLIDLLFLGFVIIQVPYLFGGMEFIQQAPDFKLAEYARRGFGELVAVSALVLPILLASHWLLRRQVRRTETIFKVLAGVQIALLFVIMASAVQRLLLLTGELGYGLTTVRFYPMVVMIWLAVVFVWFSLTVFRESRNRFAWGALWSAIVVLGATNLINPDALIARTNIALMHQGRNFDPYYNTTDLSDDAVPVIVEAMPSMNSNDRCRVMQSLYKRMITSSTELDVRSWNLSRSTARDILPQAVRPPGQIAMEQCSNDQPLPF